MCEMWVMQNFSKENVVWQANQLERHYLKAHAKTKLTSCIDDVLIVGDAQFQGIKHNVRLDHLTSYWLKAHIKSKLTSYIDDVWIVRYLFQFPPRYKYSMTNKSR